MHADSQYSDYSQFNSAGLARRAKCLDVIISVRALVVLKLVVRLVLLIAIHVRVVLPLLLLLGLSGRERDDDASCRCLTHRLELGSKELEMIVILRMNRQFMQFMREKYNYLTNDHFGRTVIGPDSGE